MFCGISETCLTHTFDHRDKGAPTTSELDSFVAARHSESAGSRSRQGFIAEQNICQALCCLTLSCQLRKTQPVQESGSQ